MIHNVYPYPAYEPSDVEWLGAVPAHWQVVPLSSVSRPKSIINQQHRELLSVYLNQGVVKFSDVNEKRTNPTSDDLSRYQAVDQGDLVLNNQQAWRGSVGVSNLEGIVSPAYLVLSLSSTLNPRFANLLFRDDSMVGQYVVCSKGVGTIQRNLYWPHLKRVLTLVPPLPEQSAIVRYLDHADRRIRRYVGAKRKLIALLEEEKQAVINRAVTRGLDPNVRLKPSGVEWLGDVPEHWEVRRAKFFYREVDERSITGIEELMSVSHITGVTPRKKTVTMFLAESNIGYKLCRSGDIVINTMWAYMAALGVARQNGLVSPSYGVYRPLDNERLDHDYINSLLRTEAYRANYLIRSTGITSSRLRLYPESFLDISVLCPPRTEQNSIVEYLGQATAAVDHAITRARHQVELLQEYRTRLIADVVTGKLDVREAAAQLPDEGDDREPIDDDPLADDGAGGFDAAGDAVEEMAMESEVMA